MGPEMHPEHHIFSDGATWSIAFATTSVLPWLDTLWEHVPSITVAYMAVSGAFMLFQVADRMGWLDSLKQRRLPLISIDDPPQEHHDATHRR
jgi:delta-aminolevulinic acid dehydratase/porphobilinogen synthase